MAQNSFQEVGKIEQGYAARGRGDAALRAAFAPLNAALLLVGQRSQAIRGR